MFVFFHDQELLNLDFFPKVIMTGIPDVPFNTYRMFATNMLNKYDRVIVVHSECNSSQVEWFEQTGAVPVYWWSHALIAQDWFRYANIDPTLDHHWVGPKQDFLIYNRAWQGLREYRLKFTELVVEHELTQHCQMKFNPIDGQHYYNHQFNNSAFKISNYQLENYFPVNTADSSSSADYCATDYINTRMEIVLETLFDDQRWHLTEKTLRPIACGQPFMIASSAGILKYLRRYGFKTFGEWIDESYDDITDPMERMHAIIAVMKNIAEMAESDKDLLFQKMKDTCDYNKKRFFSNEFTNCIVDEFRQNFDSAADQMKKHQTGAYFKFLMRKLKKYPDRWPASRQELVKIWQTLHSINC